jgi:hypothetical protein
MALASTVIPDPESHGTHDHILFFDRSSSFQTHASLRESNYYISYILNLG